MSKLDRLDPETLKDNPRATHAQWQRFEAIVKSARMAFPTSWEYPIHGLTPNTAASRLRDAIRGAIAFNYTTNTHELLEWYKKIHITHSSTHLIIRPTDMPKTSPAVQAVLSDEFPFSFDTLDQTEYDAFGTLLNSGRIIGPVHMKHAPAMLQRGWMNVEVIPRPDGSLILL